MINTKHKTPNTAKIDRPVSEADFETTGFSSLAFLPSCDSLPSSPTLAPLDAAESDATSTPTPKLELDISLEPEFCLLLEDA